MTLQTTHISTGIAKPKDVVYQYVSNPEHFPKWLAFVKSITRQSGNKWKAQTTLGEIIMDFVPQNDFGIIDHHVTLANGSIVSNHLRIIDNDEGSEVIFTLFRMPGVTPEEFDKDADSVRTDLKKLKSILEG